MIYTRAKTLLYAALFAVSDAKHESFSETPSLHISRDDLCWGLNFYSCILTSCP